MTVFFRRFIDQAGGFSHDWRPKLFVCLTKNISTLAFVPGLTFLLMDGYLGSIYGFQLEISDRTPQENYEALSNSLIVSNFYAYHGTPDPQLYNRSAHTFVRHVRTRSRNANTSQPPTSSLEVPDPGWSAFQHEPAKFSHWPALAKYDGSVQSVAANLRSGQHQLSSLPDAFPIH